MGPMINEHLDRTIAALMSDAEFMNDFPEKLESFNASRMTKKAMDAKTGQK